MRREVESREGVGRGGEGGVMREGASAFLGAFLRGGIFVLLSLGMGAVCFLSMGFSLFFLLLQGISAFWREMVLDFRRERFREMSF